MLRSIQILCLIMPRDLTLTAMFDDMYRGIRNVIENTLSEDTLISVFSQLEKYRKENFILQQTLRELESQVSDQKKVIENLNIKLTNVRFSLQKESELRRSTQKERDQYRNKEKVIAKMLENDPYLSNGTPEAIRRQIFSSLHMRNLRLIEEVEDTETSASEWEKSEDDLDRDTVKNFDACIRKPVTSVNDLDIGSSKDLCLEEVEESFLNVTSLEPLSENIATDFGKQPISTVSLTPSVNSKRSSISSCYSRTSQKSIMELKKHDFVSKKVMVMREKCNSCNSSITLLTQCYKCQLCHATVHSSCRKDLPLPCLPAVSPAASVRYITVGKLCPKVRPRVPPLLVYCVQELDGRKEPMYVNEVSETESKKLRDKLMAHKKGAPDLKSYSTKQLCGVVKSFLRRLDEPIITTTLWRDFSRVAATKDKTDRINLLEETVDQLPPPNRETLAFLMNHLQHVLEMQYVGSYHLKRTFGPFVVGNSQRNLSSIEMERQKEIQSKLMTCFLEEYTYYCNGGWEKVLNFESCKDALNLTCVPDSLCTDETLSEIVTVIEKNPRRRSSILGGSATTGMMTPLKKLSKSPMKPLF